MQAMWLENQQLSFNGDVAVPVPGEFEALIRVKLAGVCSTDLELMRGYYPFTGIPGHEFVGEVVSSPSDPSWVGKRVVGEINISCGECLSCKSGMPRHCDKRRTLGIHDWNGVFAEFLVLPLNNLHAVPDKITDQSAVFTEPVAAAYEIIEQTPISVHDEVLVIGAGRLGQLVAQVLQVTGCQLEVVARHPKQRQLLRDREIYIIADTDLLNKRYDVVVEATGTADGFLAARKCVRPRGRIMLKSTYKGNLEVNFSSIVVDEITLLGSRCGPFEPALQLMADGKVCPEPLIEASFDLEQGMTAFEQAGLPGMLKVLIKP